VIPAFNEEERLPATLDAIAMHGRLRGTPLPVVLADDGSTDRTVAVAEQTARSRGLELTVLKRPHAGKAWAVRAGMLHAAASTDVDYLLMLDADNEISIDHLADVVWTGNPSTIYIGRRVSAVGEQSGTPPSRLRRLMSGGMRILSRFLLRLPYRDTQCGFKLFPRPDVPGLFGQQRVRGWVFDAEILVIATRSGLTVAEVPVVWSPRGMSRVRPSAAASSAWALLGIALRMRCGAYRPVGNLTVDPQSEALGVPAAEP
jgi:glycosyltransferase involved in cell wall biosynthesis